MTRTLFAYVPLKGPWYRSGARTGQYEQRCHGMGQNAPTNGRRMLREQRYFGRVAAQEWGHTRR